MLVNELIAKLFYLISLILIDIFNDLNFDTLISNFETLSGFLLDVFAYVWYFLPVTYLIPLVIVVGGIIVLRIIIAVVRFIFELLQTLKFW